ncbi:MULTISPECIES: LysR family transcriptional regulator [Gammaproteobacteria]|uniref:LysR family transcriptional regulator n=1 Tax=Gammaproteobacteria TaxID=1236 RepID=UPI000978025F|nr:MULTISPECIES: LysR family transcriptional regulator [unclassified Pseudoalteromonas]MDN3488649.1 LysR family transcriptional regulator [Pseudoalteromonas sp. APC 3694]
MNFTKIDDIQAFLAVAEDESFTKAAAKIGITPSALSHRMKSLEERLGLRLLTRTTRNVSPTEAGERLITSLSPLFEMINQEVEALGELRDKPSGTIRISCTDDQIELCLRPKLAQFLENFPDVTIELYVDYGFTNVVTDRFDAGIRLGESINQDMIALPIGPDIRLVVVGSPNYFNQHGEPKTPYELPEHSCIDIRHRPEGSVYAWEFEKDGKEFTVKGKGHIVFNSIIHVLNAAVDGIGLGFVPEELARPYLNDGRLKSILTDWTPYFPGFHLYYPNRRQSSPAFLAFVEAFKHKRNP